MVLEDTISVLRIPSLILVLVTDSRYAYGKSHRSLRAFLCPHRTHKAQTAVLEAGLVYKSAHL